MNLPFPDNPCPVSLDFLARIDKDPPGTWWGSPKYDGWRRCCWKVKGKWTYTSKSNSEGAKEPMPSDLCKALEAIDWPDGIGLDCEWIGRRMVEYTGGKHLLGIFDLLIRHIPFRERLIQLQRVPLINSDSRVFKVHHWSNPGLVEHFKEQMQDPLSEGLVIRRADSTLIQSTRGCKLNPLMLKVKYRSIREDPDSLRGFFKG